MQSRSRQIPATLKLSRYLFAALRVAAALVLLFGGLTAAAASKAPSILNVAFHAPSDAVRFYYAEVTLSPASFAFDVTDVIVDGHSETFIARVDGELTQVLPNGRVERHANGAIAAGQPSTLQVRRPWANKGRIEVRVECKQHDVPKKFTLRRQATAPAQGGFPFPGWTRHRVLVLREDFGIPRENEPYLLFLSDDGDKVKSWESELRVARYDVTTGATQEIPSQVIYEKRRFDTPKQEAVHTTCEAAFLADVPANGKAYYIITYGNDAAKKPEYSSDLVMRTADDGSTYVTNDFYQAQLQKTSGQIYGMTSQQFGDGDRRDFGFIKGHGYALHYNPDVWVKNRSWTHTHGWNPPPKQTVQSGPVAVVTRRWGHLPRATEVEVEVVYHFFAKTPYVLVESTMDIMQDLVVNALRNEEVVFSPSTEVDHAGWKRDNGEVAYIPFGQNPRMTPGMINIIEADAPYICFTREANHLGMASIRLSQHAGSRGDQDPVIANTKTVIADYGWGFRYWSRSLVYPWGDFVPDHSVVLNEGAYYGERSAFCLFPLGDGDSPKARMAYVDSLSERLRHPLQVDEQGAGPW